MRLLKSFVRALLALAIRAYRALPAPLKKVIRPLWKLLPYAVVSRLMMRMQTANAEAAAVPNDTFYSDFERATLPSGMNLDDVLVSARNFAQLDTGDKTVDVVVPVYDGYEETLSCLNFLFCAQNETKHEIVVIDDVGPNPHQREALRKIAETQAITLVTNEKNLGFVASVNKGMSHDNSRDVVLLNSDTEVYEGWLDRIRAAALSAENIATVTPLSSNAEICSYPFVVRDNYMRIERPYAELDRLAAQANKGTIVDLPTGVGFCMYIKRKALNEVGLFDVETFAKGYGEENDWCMRASARGYRHVAAADTYVRHLGATSFKEDKLPAVKRAMEIIGQRYPGYHLNVQAWIDRDPLAGARRRIDEARAKSEGKKTVLFITHDWGGGTERYVQCMAALFRDYGFGTCVMRPGKLPGHVTLDSFEASPTPNLDYAMPREFDGLMAFLDSLNVARVEFNHYIRFSTGFRQLFQKWIGERGIPYDFVLHDYFTVCPRITMTAEDDSFCGGPPPELCQICVRAHSSPVGSVNISEWRREHHDMLKGAANIVAPSDDVKNRICSYYPDLKIDALPHFELETPRPQTSRPNDGRRHIALIGAIGRHKGSKVLIECLRDAQMRNLPIHFHLFGFANKEEKFDGFDHITIHGKYKEEDLPSLLASDPCDMFLLPALWPETFSYTLSSAFAAGIYPVCFDIGAPAERIRAANWGTVIPFDLATKPAELNDTLLNLRTTPRPESVLKPFHHDMERHREWIRQKVIGKP